MAEINHCVVQEDRFTLLHKNFDFSWNVDRNFNTILGYTIFKLISIIHKPIKMKSSVIFLNLIIFRPALELTNSDLQSQQRKCFTKDFLVEVLDLCHCLHKLYYHYQTTLLPSLN